MRGYLVQTVASLLDALHTSNDWEAVSLEPLHESEKVDVKWRFPNGRVKVVQIKSSQNPFGEQKIKNWCTVLANSTEADQYELQLVGRLTSNSKPLQEYEGVCILSPIPLDVERMLKEIAYDLSVYCEQRTIPIPKPLAAGILTKALILHLEIESISGKWINRENFDALLKRWIFTLIPEIKDIDSTADLDTIREAIKSFQPEPWIQPLKLQKLENRSNSETGLLDVLDEDDKIALAGISGSGKTYAMRMAANKLNRSLSRLCFWIPLKSYIRNLDHTIKRALGWYDLPDDQVIPTLQKHQVVLLLDGLNEVIEEKRRQCTTEVQHLLDTYQGQLCISYPLSDYAYFGFDCPTYKISPLSKRQIEQAIKTFFSTGGEPSKATRFLQSVRRWDPGRQQDFDVLAQTPINLQFLLELAQANDFEYSSLRDLYGQVIQKRLGRIKRYDQRGQISVGIKTECLMNLAYRSIAEEHPLQMQRAFVQSAFSDCLEPSEMDLALEEIIRAGLLLEVNEFLVEWPHASFRDYLAGRRLFDLVETEQPIDTFPLEKLDGSAAAAHATKLATTQSRRLGNRSTVFLATLHRQPSFEAMKIVAEEYHTSLEYYISTDQDLECDAERYRKLRWGERFLETYGLIADIARQRGFPSVDRIPSPKGLTVFFDSEADFCAMIFSDKKGIYFDQLQNFDILTLQAKKRKRSCVGICLFAPFLLLLDPEIVAYLQVGVWLRLKADKAQTELNEWHSGLATYLSPRNAWINWSQPQELPEPKFELCANPQQTFRILSQTYEAAQVDQLRALTGILVHSRKEFLSWQEIYMPITFQIDPTKVRSSPKPVSNRLSQMMVLTPPDHHISLALLMPWSHKIDLGVSIFVPFPVPLLNRYYFCSQIATSDNLRLSFVHLHG
ncbi:MAG: hypothetical protein DRP09_16500 [Candidatus Thorarchaeota archaeon]|nr:MAG: hypothetical protein DRP09_16500 [Candidatus Thorarchaeota archaeon]